MQLKREIGFWGSAFLVLNGLIGAGIFALPAKMAEQLGSFSPWAFLLFGTLMLSIVWCFGQLSKRYPETGGPVIYSQAAFGDFAAFQTGWLYYLARVTAIAANMHVLLLYAGYLWPSVGQGVGLKIAIMCMTLGLITINIIGLRGAMRFLDGLTFIKLTPFVLLLGFGLIHATPNFAVPSIPSLDAVGAGALLTLYAFIGFETAVITSGETKNARANIPRSLIIMVVCITVFYFCIQLVYWHVMGTSRVESAPLISLADALLGPTGALVMTLTAVASIGGNLLANVISTSRLTYALAKEKNLPSYFGLVSRRFATPYVSIIVLGVFAGALALTGSFIWLAIASVLARLMVYAMCILSLMKIEASQDAANKGNSSSIRLGLVIPPFALIVCAWALMQSTRQAWFYLIGEILLGAVIFWLIRKRRRDQAR